MKCKTCELDKVILNDEEDCLNCADTKIIARWHKSKAQTTAEFLESHGQLKLPKEEFKTTLPTDSKERKDHPLMSGCLKYFPAALAGVARTSKLGNDKHNPGQELHHARGKSSDHGDCILRHMMDTQDLLAAKERGQEVTEQQILDEASQMAWRALAFSQELHERLGSAPLAPGAKNG